MLHIKECFCRSLSSTGEGKHSLYCADLAHSPYFIPPLPGPRKDSLTLSPRNKLGGPRTTHRAAHVSFPPASPPQLLVFFMIALYRSYFCLPPSVAGPRLLSAQPGRGGGNAACPLFHVSLCAPAPCLFECADVNCREDGHLAWYICSRDHPAGLAGTRGVEAVVFNASAVPRAPEAEWD